MDSLFIGKDYYHFVSRGIIKESMESMKNDTLIYFIDDLIYYKEDNLLQGGYSYTQEGDSSVIFTEDHDIVQFGKEAFVRYIDYGYILNIQHESMIDWWQLRFIDLRNPEMAVICELSKQDENLLPPHEILSEEFPNYLRGSWTKSDIKELLDKGGFSDTLLVLEYEEQL